MTRVEITDEMVRAAFDVYGPRAGYTEPGDCTAAHKARMRQALEAAIGERRKGERRGVSLAARDAGHAAANNAIADRLRNEPSSQRAHRRAAEPDKWPHRRALDPR